MKTVEASRTTKDKLLDVAQALMISKGFVATTVDEICAKAKVTKGSFFHYFKSKEDLGKQLLKRFSEAGCCMIEEQLAKAGPDPLDRVFAYFDFFIHASKSPEFRGCLVGSFTQEISDTHPELRSACEKNFRGLAERFREDLVKARAKHPPRMDFNAASLADYFLSVIQGSIILFKATRDRAVLEKNFLHLKKYLEILFGVSARK